MQVMTNRDPAFMWETEAIRSAAHRVAEEEIDAENSARSSDHWMTLREASRNTGIPVETLRKWARRGTIPSYLSSDVHGTRIRFVDIEGVTRRADDLGREITPQPRESRSAAPPPEPPPPEPPPLSPPPPTTPSPAAPPPGSMIIPVDAWNKMLTQLGNLHEAGQQLAEARERAAKAETEAGFLRERLAELRRQVEATQRQEPAPPPPPPDRPEPATPADERVWDYAVRRIRGWRRG